MIGIGCERKTGLRRAFHGDTVQSDVVLAATRCAKDQTMEKDIMIDLIRELIDLLSQDAIDVAHIAARIGRVKADPGVPMPLDLLPQSPILNSARLSRYPASGLPYVLTLQPKSAFRPAVAALKAAFGPCSRALTGRGMPVEFVFDPAGSGRRWKVTMIATLVRDAAKDEDSLVSSIALRRDPVTQ